LEGVLPNQGAQLNVAPPCGEAEYAILNEPRPFGRRRLHKQRRRCLRVAALFVLSIVFCFGIWRISDHLNTVENDLFELKQQNSALATTLNTLLQRSASENPGAHDDTIGGGDLVDPIWIPAPSEMGNDGDDLDNGYPIDPPRVAPLAEYRVVGEYLLSPKDYQEPIQLGEMLLMALGFMGNTDSKSPHALQGFSLRIIDQSGKTVPELTIRYMAHMGWDANTTWMDQMEWVKPKEPLRSHLHHVQGVAFKLEGIRASLWDVVYTVWVRDGPEPSRVQAFAPCKNGEFCGTTGQSRSVHGVKVELKYRGDE